MKWIDNQDDYFLRDFDKGRKGEANAATDNGPETRDEASSGQGADCEFIFPPSGTQAGDKNPGYGGSDVDGKPRRRHRGRRILRRFMAAAAAVLVIAFYIRYFVPHTEESRTVGYITLVEKRGLIFKTFEGEMVSESHLSDTTKIYSRDFCFSIPDDSLGRLIQSYQGSGRKVTLTAKKYYGTLPWRGSQKAIVTDVKAD